MKNEKVKALWAAIKLPLRIFVLSILPIAITWLGGFDAQWAGVAITLLVVLDKYLHELESAKPVKKQNDGVLGVRGLTGF